MHLLRFTGDSLIPAAAQTKPFAAVGQANIALVSDETTHHPPDSSRVVYWSGWLDVSADPARGLFARDFRVWSRAGWDALNAACDTLLPALTARGIELCLRPHARHVLSDPQACLSFLRQRSGVRLLLDPASLMTGSMLATAEDHLARIFEALGSHPAAVAIVLSNVQRNDASDEDSLGPVPLHQGLIEPRLIINAWRAHCSPDLPCALLDNEFEAQATLLAAT